MDFRKVINSVVATTFFLSTIASAQPSSNETKNELSDTELHQLVAEGLTDPRITALEENKNLAQPLDLSPSDSLVDQDPFFMRAQSWSHSVRNKNAELGAPEFSPDDVSSSLHFRTLGKTWTLRAPLHPILKTANRVFFAANRGAKLFNGDGEGIFFVSYNDLTASSISGQPVPVEFFALPGDGWQANAASDVSGFEIPEEDVTALRSTDGTILPISNGDIESVARVESFNLYLAQVIALDQALAAANVDDARLAGTRNELLTSLARLGASAEASHFSKPAASSIDFSAELKKFTAALSGVLGNENQFPPRGSTASFGMLYTGFDLDHPERSFAAKQKPSFKDLALNFIGLPQAQANPFLTPGPLQDNLLRAGSILAKCGYIFLASIVLRYDGFLPRIKWLRKTGFFDWQIGNVKVGKYFDWKLLGPKIDNNIKQGITTPKKAWFDIYAHALTFVAQVPAVWSVNFLETIMDQAGASETGRVRKLFNSTFGYSRQTNTRTPVDSKTLLFGVAILGGVDSALVLVQQYFLIPPILLAVAYVIPPLAPRVHAFLHSPAGAIYSLLAVMNNIVGYITSGAYSYASQKQDITTNNAKRLIAEKMVAEGHDPEDPQYKKEYNNRIDEMVRADLLKQGLPNDRSWLFDATSTYQGIQKFFGYEAPAGDRPQDYLGVTRSGLMRATLSQSMAAARAAGDQGAYGVLESAKIDFSLLTRFLDSPEQFMSLAQMTTVARAFRRVRQELTAFTYSDPNTLLQTLPDSWNLRGSAANVRDAANYFRRAYFQRIGVRNAAELKETIVVTEDKAELIKSYDPMSDASRFEKNQLLRALSRANEAFVAEAGTAPEVVAAEVPGATVNPQRNLWESLYRKELLNISGIHLDQHPDSQIFNTTLLNQTDRQFAEKLTKEPELQTYLDELSPLERSRVEVILRTDLFIQIYGDATVNAQLVPTLSPIQPGIAQRLRQRQFVRNSKMLTSSLRGIEGFFSNTRYQRGLGPLLRRTLPYFGEDWLSGNVRAIRAWPLAATFGQMNSRFVWHTALPYKDAMVNYLYRGTAVSGPWATNNRISDNMGWRPGESMWGMLKYAVIGSFLTMTGGVFYGLFHDQTAPFIWATMAALTTRGLFIDKFNVAEARVGEFCQTQLARLPQPKLPAGWFDSLSSPTKQP